MSKNPNKNTLGSSAKAPRVGECKAVRNPRTGLCMSLCFVGKDKSRSGWQFKKGSSRACSL